MRYKTNRTKLHDWFAIYQKEFYFTGQKWACNTNPRWGNGNKQIKVENWRGTLTIPQAMMPDKAEDSRWNCLVAVSSAQGKDKAAAILDLLLVFLDGNIL